VYRALSALQAAYEKVTAAPGTNASAQELREVALGVLKEVGDRFPPFVGEPRTLDKPYSSKLTYLVVTQEPLINRVEYVSIGSPATMEELEIVDRFGAVVSVAVRLGSVRLIDNILLSHN